MAGNGPAPKDPTKRRTRHVPQRGDWVELPARNDAKTPSMPAAPKGGWAAETKMAWKLWWEDPASLQWTPADRASVRSLAYLHHEVERGKGSFAGEVRLRMDGLGLTQKGKRDMRWRVVETVAEDEKPPSRPKRRDHLKVVGA